MAIEIFVIDGHAVARVAHGGELSASGHSRVDALARLLNRLVEAGYKGKAYLVVGDDLTRAAGIESHGVV
ncbi:MAG: hypothetical protein IT374_14905 [Polyangiaceae bacterium]|nr:hypothetical protein [Polyangiaceae bacterium]